MQQLEGLELENIQYETNSRRYTVWSKSVDNIPSNRLLIFSLTSELSPLKINTWIHLSLKVYQEFLKHIPFQLIILSKSVFNILLFYSLPLCLLDHVSFAVSMAFQNYTMFLRQLQSNLLAIFRFRFFPLHTAEAILLQGYGIVYTSKIKRFDDRLDLTIVYSNDEILSKANIFI